MSCPAGAWLQFMVHDWFEVQKDLSAPPLEFPLPAGGTMPLQPASVSQDDSGINSKFVLLNPGRQGFL
jgi:hypothetical protein